MRRKRESGFAMLLVFLMAAGVSFATSPEYVVQSVTVEGSKVLSLDQAGNVYRISPSGNTSPTEMR